MIKLSRQSRWFVLLPTAIIFLCILATHPAYAVCSTSTISFDFCTYDRGFIATLTVTDASANHNSALIETVPVTITSQADPAGIQMSLQETGVNTGVFTGKLIFMPTNNLFPFLRAITITQEDTSANTHSNAIDTTTDFVTSDNPLSSPLAITLSETGQNTGVFQGKLTFSGFSSSTQNTFKATGGDFIGIVHSSLTTRGLITPNPYPYKGAILVNNVDSSGNPLSDTITATYNGVSVQALEQIGSGGGGGGGGVVAPSLVLDVTAGTVGGGAPPPPAFSLHNFVAANALPQSLASVITNEDALTPIEPTNSPGVPFYPLMIDGKGYLLGGYADTIDTVSEQVGKQMTFTLGTISSPVVHISLFTNLHSLYDTMSDSDTYIIYDKGSPLKIVDPHGFFQNVTLTPTINGTKQSFAYDITFAKPMNKSNIMIRAWDNQQASTDLTIYDAWQVTPQISVSTQNATQQAELSRDLLTQKIAPVQDSTIQDNTTDTGLLGTIKDWGGYSPTPMSDSQLLAQVGIDGKFIPPWFAHTAKWVVQGVESQQDFVDGIKYLYQKGLIH